LVAWRLRVRQHRLLFLIRQLLADHHVYVRSGPASRYVVLGWPWQVGVSLAILGFLAWTGLASYGWIAAHLELLEQRRELARLVEINRPREAETTPADLAAGAARLAEELDQIKAGERAAGASELVAAEADALAGEPAAGNADGALLPEEAGMAAGWRLQRLLPAALQFDGSSSGRDWLYDRLARHRSDDPARAEVFGLRAELHAARAEIARLKSALGAEAIEAER
jgi:hypothetical protein